MDSLRGHLVDVCRQARDDAGASRTKIAAVINKGEQSVSRFEQGVGGWHTQTGELVGAYAQVAGIPAWELWQMAVDLWREAEGATEVQPRQSPAVQTRPDTGTRLDIDALRDTIHKRLGSDRSKPRKVSGPMKEDPRPKHDPQRPRRHRQASGNA